MDDRKRAGEECTIVIFVEEDNLERLFARRSVRKVSKDLSFQYEGEFYVLISDLPLLFLLEVQCNALGTEVLLFIHEEQP